MGFFRIRHRGQRRIGYESHFYSKRVKNGTVGVSSLNVRSAASHDSAIMTKLSRGTKVSILSEDHGWLKIEANGQKGWAASHYIIKDSDSSDSASGSGDGSAGSGSSKKRILFTAAPT